MKPICVAEKCPAAPAAQLPVPPVVVGFPEFQSQIGIMQCFCTFCSRKRKILRVKTEELPI